jgi:hypothetical protein
MSSGQRCRCNQRDQSRLQAPALFGAPDALLNVFPEYASAIDFFDEDDRTIPHIFLVHFMAYLSDRIRSGSLTVDSPSIASLFHLIEEMNNSSEENVADFVRSGFFESMTSGSPEDKFYEQAAKHYLSPTLYHLFRFIQSRRAGDEKEE